MNLRLAEAAISLLGVRFRLHGRDPRTGLDCVGLVGEAMRRAGTEPVLPEGYQLRSISLNALLPFALANRLEPTTHHHEADISLLMVNPVQPHLVIPVPGGVVHAHAGLGRVTFLPGAMPWPMAGAWRLPTSKPSTGN